jgi:hypothetical protein
VRVAQRAPHLGRSATLAGLDGAGRRRRWGRGRCWRWGLSACSGCCGRGWRRACTRLIDSQVCREIANSLWCGPGLPAPSRLVSRGARLARLPPCSCRWPACPTDAAPPCACIAPCAPRNASEHDPHVPPPTPLHPRSPARSQGPCDITVWRGAEHAVCSVGRALRAGGVEARLLRPVQ